jgi:hypothetical protein
MQAAGIGEGRYDLAAFNPWIALGRTSAVHSGLNGIDDSLVAEPIFLGARIGVLRLKIGIGPGLPTREPQQGGGGIKGQIGRYHASDYTAALKL